MGLEVMAVSKYIRMSPRKVRLVVDLVRGKGAVEALAMLRLLPKAASRPVSKAISSAVANAEENYGLSRDDLYITRITADAGPSLRRRRFGARGRYKPILRRSAHVTVVLSEREE
jgi:large subunit ribosomal protein L22